MFTLCTVNSAFFTEVVLDDQEDADAALAAGARGALMIAMEEIGGGASSAVVEVIVEDADGQQVRRSAVSISIAALAIGMGEKREPLAHAND